MSITVDEIRPFLPSDAYDITIKDFVARWKTPNKHIAGGYQEARFLSAAFLAAIRDQLPALKDWALVDYYNEPVTHLSDRAGLTDGKVKIWVSCRSWGANAYSKVLFQAYAVSKDNQISTKTIKISCSLDRPITAIAKDIERRILPTLDAAKAEVDAKARAEHDAVKLISDKAASLARRYPNLRIQGDARNRWVSISTKYGAKIQLNCYTYEDSRSGFWCLTSERGTAFRLDDIDSPYGRAFLKLCNDN